MGRDDVDGRAQLRAVRRELHALARAALHSYDVMPRSVRLLEVATNATYLVVDERGRRFALRVSIPGPTDHTELEARSEISWLEDLAAARDLAVAAPVRTASGDSLVLLAGPDAGTQRRCVGRAHVISNTALQLDLDDEIVGGVLARTEQLAHDTLGDITPPRTTPPAA